MADDEYFEIAVDNSESKAPRSFPDFDKYQIDSTKRKILKNVREKMLDFNEEYLAKHPQVEAILRLIVMELLCHKPYDVRQFVKNLLKQDNLETRVAKIILSKRINLERNHTEEYFHHVAEWEAKCNDDSGPFVKRPEWPEPRPYRREKRRDKKEYCHLHYFTEPYFLHPKELVRMKDTTQDTSRLIRKLPKWKSEFLTKEFLWRWSNPLKQAESKEVLVEGEKSKDAGVNERNLELSNRYLLFQCPTCRKAVMGVNDELEVTDTNRFSCRTRLGTSLCTGRSLSASHENKQTYTEMAKELVEEWKRGKKIEVYKRHNARGQEIRLNEKGQRMVRVLAEKHEYNAKEIMDYLPNWEVKGENQDIEYLVPMKDLEEDYSKDIDLVNFNKSKENKNKEDSELASAKWNVPLKYRNPIYQVVITQPEDPLDEKHVPVTDLEGNIVRMTKDTNQEEQDKEMDRQQTVFVTNLQGDIPRETREQVEKPVLLDNKEFESPVTEIIEQRKKRVTILEEQTNYPKPHKRSVKGYVPVINLEGDFVRDSSIYVVNSSAVELTDEPPEDDYGTRSIKIRESNIVVDIGQITQREARKEGLLSGSETSDTDT